MEATDEAAGSARLLGRHLAVPVTIFLASRLVTFAVAYTARVLEPQPLADLLSRWDGAHYLDIAVNGYPVGVPRGSGATAQTVHAFFPGYPLLVRSLRAVTGMAPVPAALAVNIGMATVAAALVWLLARDLLGHQTATRTVLLFSFFPGAFVLGMAYSEGTFIALAAGCLLALHRRQWVVAGLAAAAAGATRPTGLVLALCCAWAAVEAVRRRREWLAVAAPALAPLGFLAWSAYLEVHTGSADAWLYSQRGGWGQGLDFGRNTAVHMGRFVADPLHDLDVTVAAPMIVVMAIGLALLWRWRPPATLAIYTVGIVLPAVASTMLISTARFALSAFPLHMAASRSLGRVAFAVVLALSAAAMTLLMLVAELSLELTP